MEKKSEYLDVVSRPKVLLLTPSKLVINLPPRYFIDPRPSIDHRYQTYTNLTENITEPVTCCNDKWLIGAELNLYGRRYIDKALLSYPIYPLVRYGHF